MQRAGSWKCLLNTNKVLYVLAITIAPTTMTGYVVVLLVSNNFFSGGTTPLWPHLREIGIFQRWGCPHRRSSLGEKFFNFKKYMQSRRVLVCWWWRCKKMHVWVACLCLYYIFPFFPPMRWVQHFCRTQKTNFLWLWLPNCIWFSGGGSYATSILFLV